MTNAIKIDLVQGSPEWEAYRREQHNASELACAQNIHPINSRRDMLRVYATGTPIEYSDYVRNKVFPRGHKVEAEIRPIAEDKFNKDFIPKVYQLDGTYSASLDGIDPVGEEILEIKQYNEELYDMVAGGVMPDYHMPQVQQCLWITGAKRCIFAVANKEATDFVHVIVEPDLDYHEKIPRIWEKFDEDVKSYTDVEQHTFIVEIEPDNHLPVARLSTDGITVYSNIPHWFAEKKAMYEGMTKDEITPDSVGQFKVVRDNFKKSLPYVKALHKKLTDSIKPISDVVAELARIEKYLTSSANDCDGVLVDFRRKIRQEACDKAEQELLNYLKAKESSLDFRLNFTMPNMMKMVNRTQNNDALASAIGAIVADSKIAIDREAESLSEKKRWFEENAGDYSFLFDDLPLIIYTPTEHFQMTVELRIVKHKEQERIAAEQAKTKAIAEAEEQAYREKLERENQEELEHAAAKAEQKRVVDNIDTGKQSSCDQAPIVQTVDVQPVEEPNQPIHVDALVSGNEAPETFRGKAINLIATHWEIDYYKAEQWLINEFSNITETEQ